MEKICYEESSEMAAKQLMKRETERLMKRNAERQRESERRREERDQSSASNEKLDLFFKTFEAKKMEIEDDLKKVGSGSLAVSELPYHFDGLVKDIESLKHYISSSSYFLRVYDIRKAQESLQDLQQNCQKIEDCLLPKKKFRFKSRKLASKSKQEIFSTEIEDFADSKVSNSQFISGSDIMCGFSNKSDENLYLNDETIFKKDVTLSNLENCTIRLSGVPSTLNISNLRQSHILCGPVATSVLIEDCIDCIFVLSCQQMRIHSSFNCDFYLHVTSRTIIENTREVRFAPYVWRYENVDRHFRLAGLDITKNNWDFIDDFNWLAWDKPSPHWRALEDSEHNLDWI